MKKIIYILGVLFASFSIASAVESVNLVITKNNGQVETKQVQLEKVGKNVSKLVVKKSDIPSDSYFINVVADNAQAIKGEKGFWLGHRGYLGEFIEDNGAFGQGEHRFDLPYFAMKNERETFIGIVDGMRWQCSFRVEVKDGVYTVFPRFRVDEKNGFDFYEDIVVTFYKLPQSADYNEMAKTYRKHKLAKDKEIVSLKKRFKTQPLLKKHSEGLYTGILFAQKTIEIPRNEHIKTNYTFENEPPVKSKLFSWGAELLKDMKDAGIDKAYVCTYGWQSGGYDGRTPTIFPIEEAAGGEEELKKYIKTGQDLGYLIGMIVDYTDTYTCSRDYSDELVCKHPSGKLEKNGAWRGGMAWNICLEYAYNKFIPQQLNDIKKLGFDGGIFFDVNGAVYPYRCCDPKHPANRAKQGEYHYKMMKMSRPLFGVVGQEGGFDDYISQVDFINYPSTSFDDGVRTMKDEPSNKGGRGLRYTIVPFWELVYHDFVISSPYRMYLTKDFFSNDKYLDHQLRMVEFAGRPLYYHMNDFPMSELVKAYNFYKTYRHLIPERMKKHSKIADGVFRTDFGNGAYVVVNYNKKPFAYEGEKIPAKGYIVK